MLTTAAALLAAASLALTTQNVQAGLPPAQARHDIRQAAAGSSVVLAQEMGRRVAPRFAPPGWGWAHFGGLRRGDCAAYWNRAQWRLVRTWPTQLTFATLPLGRGHRWALTTILRGVGIRSGIRLAVVCVHQITHALDRQPTYRYGTHRLALLLARLATHHRYVAVGGDWNMPYPQDHRLRLSGFPARVLPAQGLAGRAPAAPTGPKGGRVDYWYTQRPGLAAIGGAVLRGTYSDHDGSRIRLRLMRG